MKKSRVFTVFILLLLCFTILISGCAKGKLKYEYAGEAIAAPPYPDAVFAVISDLHFYDTALGTTGSAFEETMNSDRKLLLDSLDLLDYAINEIIKTGVQFVLVPGDLTKDGELQNHRIVAERLGKLKNAGIAAFVVPGNHDINNPDAVSYSGDSTSPVPSVSAEEFSQIYGDFGFNAALMRDDDSLSYAAEPVPGLWILGIDACRYRENVPGKEEIVSGKISQKTADWIAGVLQAAVSKNKAVMVMMHHGVVEHWKGESKLHPDYLINDYINFGKFLASYNVRLDFSGHYHAQDISLARFGNTFLYDIETGSLVTAPCPMRFLEIKNNFLSIRSETIADKIHPGTDFADRGRAFVKRTVYLEAIKTLKKFFASGKDADYIADAVGDAFDAHYAGDENPALKPVFDESKLGLWGRFIYSQEKYVIDGLWIDLPPADNNVSFALSF